MEKLLQNMKSTFEELESKIKLISSEANFQMPIELKEIDINFIGIEISSNRDEYKLTKSYRISEKSDNIIHNDCRGWTRLTKENIERTKKLLEIIKKNSIENHEHNIKATEHNKKYKDNLVKLMKNLGFVDYRYQEYGTKRNTKSYKTNAFWLNEIEKHYPSEYKIDLEEKYNNIILECEEAFKKYDYKIKQEKVEKEKQNKQRELKKMFSILCSKYDLNYDVDCDCVLNTIINNDKYLYCAHYLLENRNDWNDGYDYAKQSLTKLDSNNSTDILIINEIQSIIDSGDIDGRHFRDCKWNYDVLFGMADKDIIKDYNIAKELVDAEIEEWESKRWCSD